MAIWNRATIEIGPQLDDSIVVLKGLKPGDRVVSSANFLVDSEAQLQAAIGAFTPPAATTGASGVGERYGGTGPDRFQQPSLRHRARVRTQCR